MHSRRGRRNKRKRASSSCSSSAFFSAYEGRGLDSCGVVTDRESRNHKLSFKRRLVSSNFFLMFRSRRGDWIENCTRQRKSILPPQRAREQRACSILASPVGLRPEAADWGRLRPFDATSFGLNVSSS